MTEKIHRRTLAKGIAWSVPAVAIASPVHAFAASPMPPDGPIRFTGKACKLPGSSSQFKHGYVYDMLLVNEPGPNPLDARIVINSVVVGGYVQRYVAFKFPNNDEPGKTGTCSSCVPDSPPGQAPIVLNAPEDTTHRVLLYSSNAGNSANLTVTVHYTVYDCEGACEPEQFTAGSVGSTNPIIEGGGGSCDVLLSADVFPLPPAVHYPNGTAEPLPAV